MTPSASIHAQSRKPKSIENRLARMRRGRGAVRESRKTQSAASAARLARNDEKMADA
jgi:hypothetical protein